MKCPPVVAAHVSLRVHIVTGSRVDGNGGVLMGDMTGGECSVVCGLIHGGIWETQDLGASASSTPVKKVRETQTPPWCIPSLKSVVQICFAQARWVMVWCLSTRYSVEPSTSCLALPKRFPDSVRKSSEGCSLIES